MSLESKTKTTLLLLTVTFAVLAVGFYAGPSSRPGRQDISLVDTNFLSTATARRSYADLIQAKEDLSDFDCYACHEKGKAPILRYDTNQTLIVPKEHGNIVMHHGSHERNNNCFNCHDELNLEHLQTRDKRELKLSDSTPLCGSCHGPTYRDWEAGVHGRTAGFWQRSQGAYNRENCVNCHNPHSPKFPGRMPAPGPHPLREVAHASAPGGSHGAAPPGETGGTPPKPAAGTAAPHP